MRAIATLSGMAAIADAVAKGETVNITHIAIGDGIWSPDENATSLQSERIKAPILEVQVIENNIRKISALAEGTEEFFISEIGVIGHHNGEDILLAITASENPIQWKPANQPVPLELLMHFAAFPEGSVTINATVNNNLSLLKPMVQQSLATIRNSRVAICNHLKNIEAI